MGLTHNQIHMLIPRTYDSVTLPDRKGLSQLIDLKELRRQNNHGVTEK
jgi:hypothetical protein